MSLSSLPLLDRRRFLVSLAASAATSIPIASAQPRVARVGLVTGGPRALEGILQACATPATYRARTSSSSTARRRAGRSVTAQRSSPCSKQA